MPPLPNQAATFRYPTIGESMAISHELSCDIATAILSAKKRTSDELHHLKKIVLHVHSILQQMTEQERAARRKPPPDSEKGSSNTYKVSL